MRNGCLTAARSLLSVQTHLLLQFSQDELKTLSKLWKNFPSQEQVLYFKWKTGIDKIPGYLVALIPGRLCQ